MRKIDLGQTITILANVGVIVGIAFLAIELNQNNALLRNEARYNLHLARTQELEQTALDPGLAQIFEKVENNEQLSGVEARRFRAAFGSRFVRWEWYYEQFRAGLIEEDVLPVVAWRTVLRQNPAAKEVWLSRSQFHSPAFVQWMEENVVNPQ